MVILPFYQFLIGFAEKDQTKYAFLAQNGHLVSANIPVRYPSYHSDSRTLYGIWNKNGKDVIGRALINPAPMDFSPLFTLSNKRISYTAISPDNLKIAFLVKDPVSAETQLRVIVHEEFGWFPLPFLRLPASESSVCFSSSDVLIYTDPAGSLKAVRLSKPVKVVEVTPSGRMPACSVSNNAKAFIQNDKIFVFNKIQNEIDVKHPLCLSFSKNEKDLFFSENGTLCKYDTETRQKQAIFQGASPIVFIAEL